MRSRRCWFLVVIAAAMAGCSRDGDPGPRLSVAEVQARLEARAKAIRSVRAECRIVISKRGRGSVELRGVLIAEKPSRFRLRAWKASQVVFDLTATPEGTWLLADDDDAGRRRGGAAGGAEGSIAEAQIHRAAELLLGVPEAPLRAAGKGDAIVYEQPLRNGEALARCKLSRFTTLLESCDLVGPGGRTRAEVRFDQYRPVEGVALAREIEFRAGGLRIEIDVTDIELNPQLSDVVFQPPGDARPLRAS